MAGRLNIDQILRDLEQVKTAEQIFAEGIQDKKVEPVAEPKAEEKTAEAVVTTEAATEPVVEAGEKVAAEKKEECKKEDKKEDKKSDDCEEKKAEAEVVDETEKVAEMQKIAAELDAQGRIMARAFMDELQKLAYAIEYAEQARENEVTANDVEATEKTASDEGAVRILTDLYNMYF